VRHPLSFQSLLPGDDSERGLHGLDYMLHRTQATSSHSMWNSDLLGSKACYLPSPPHMKRCRLCARETCGCSSPTTALTRDRLCCAAARHLYHIGSQLGVLQEDQGSGWFAPTRRAWRFPRPLNLIAQVPPDATWPCMRPRQHAARKSGLKQNTNNSFCFTIYQK